MLLVRFENKWSFEKGPFSRDSRDFRDSRDVPEGGKSRRCRRFSRVSGELEIVEILEVSFPNEGSGSGGAEELAMTKRQVTAFCLCGSELRHSEILRAACLQNEIAPEKFLNRYEKRFEKHEKGSEKRSETRLKKRLPLSGRLKIFHRHFSTNFKSFSPPKIFTKKKVFFHREALQGGPR